MGFQTASLVVLWLALALSSAFTIKSGRIRNHGHYVCSTWGNYHFKTFDGDYYQFPGECSYNLASDCRDTYQDFSIHVHRKIDGGHPVIDKITMTIKDVIILLKGTVAVVNGAIAKTPYYSFGILIQKTDTYFKVYAKTGLTLMWNREDAVMVELDPKYNNRTCGLCGDYNGVPTYDEFIDQGIYFSPEQFGNMQKINDPNIVCTDVDETQKKETSHCSQYRSVCEEHLGHAAFSGCQDLLNVEAYINACVLDMCSCGQSQDSFCLCSTISEYSRQCSHAGGRPGNWRTDSFCPKQCPSNMIYQESASPCKNSCSHLEIHSLCEEHYMDGCFCPEGTVLDDYTEKGCVPVNECHCKHRGNLYAPGETIQNDCDDCRCISGRWNCTDRACPGACSIEGGAHISTFDGKAYTFHGDCYYVLSKGRRNESHVILGEMTPCSSLARETCLKSVVLLTDNLKNVVTFKADGTVLLNELKVTLPHVTASFSIMQPSGPYIIVQAAYGLQMQIQLQPLMQLYISMEKLARGRLQGLCGNFNSKETDDFVTSGGLVEATASSFANTWKAQPNCHDVSDLLDDPCSLSIENKNYADYWCTKLEKDESPFAKCHSAVDPTSYVKRCRYDSCNCKDSEKCMCAALSSYVRACAAKGIILWGWRNGICDKDISSCPATQIYLYNLTTCQPTCRSLAEGEKACASGFTPVDGCGCPNGEFLNEKNQCVPISQCSCYYHGSYLEPLDVINKQDERCTCHNGKLVCISHAPDACPEGKIYYDCNEHKSDSRTPTHRSCKTLGVDYFPTECISGCVCPDGLLDDGAGGCVPEERCPCIHNDDIYPHGTKVKVNCNTCTCQRGQWTCTDAVCYATCSIYGSGHYITFDEKLYDFDGNCEFVAAQDYCGPNQSLGSFSIITENVPCGTTGVTCSKSIKIFLGDKVLKLADKHIVETDVQGIKSVSYLTREVGMYLVIEANNGVLLIWDRKTTIFIKVSPAYKGKLCGLCGNFDDNSQNDFTTSHMIQVGDVLEFGNSWKVDPTCPDAIEVINPCSQKPHRQAWAEKQCGIIKSDVFKVCHSKVDPKPFYEACVRDACSCDSGGDCECFCTAVAAYAQECTKSEACVYWRTPDICPIFCDYYNPEDECEWHYHPCGNHNIETCRSINNVYTNVTITFLEGCYPTCPEDKPIFDESKKICVPPELCGCYIDNNHYDNGEEVPSTEPCHTCVCNKEGKVECVYDPSACFCIIDGVRYEEGEIISSEEHPSGICIVIICLNGTQHEKVEVCTTTAPTTTSITTTVPSTTVPTTTTTTTASTPPSTTCILEKVCRWTQWFDVSKPGEDLDSGDYETYEEIRKHYEFCSVPEQIQCRAANAPDASLESLEQTVHCNVSYGLICHNSEQKPDGNLWRRCYNYEVRMDCCDLECVYSTTMTTTTTTTPTTTTPTTTTPTTTTPTTTTPTTTTPTTTTPTTTTPTTTTPTTTTPTTTTPTTTTPTTTTPTTTTPTTTTPTSTTLTTTSPTTTASTTTSPTTTTITTTSTTTSPTTTSETTTLHTGSTCVEFCEWSDWFDVSYPKYEPNGGDYETYENIRKEGLEVCEKPENISCRSTKFPDIPLEDLGQIVTCDVSTGLVCNNKDQTGFMPVCYNYEISVYCCNYCTTPPTTTPSTTTETTTTPTTTTTTTISTTTSVTTTPTPTETTTTTTKPTPTESTTTNTTPPPSTSTCVEFCEWSDWFDVSYPKYEPNGGDYETYENIRKEGLEVCEKPENISCRSQKFPDIPLEDLGQIVTCDVSTGLVCNNKDQTGFMPVCYNYEISVYCCHYCGPSPQPPTTTETTTTQSTSSTTTTTPPIPTESTTTTTETTPGTTTTTEPTPGTTTTTKPTPGTTTTTEPTPGTTTTTKPTPGTTTTTEPTPGTTTTTEPTPGTTTTTETTTATTTTSTETIPSTISTTAETTPGTTTTVLTTTESTTLSTTTTESTTISVTTSTTSTVCTEYCAWTDWFDVSYPKYEPNGGDYETYENIRKEGLEVCEKPENISCRAQKFPDIPLEDLGQIVTCDVSTGLVCHNKDQTGFMPVCYNYEISVYCCNYCTTPPTTTPSTTTKTTTTTSLTTTPTPTEKTTTTTEPTPGTTTTTTEPTPSTTTTTEPTPSTTTTTEPTPSTTTTTEPTPSTTTTTTETTPGTISTTIETTPSTTTTTTESTTTSSVTTPPPSTSTPPTITKTPFISPSTESTPYITPNFNSASSTTPSSAGQQGSSTPVSTPPRNTETSTETATTPTITTSTKTLSTTTIIPPTPTTTPTTPVSTPPTTTTTTPTTSTSKVTTITTTTPPILTTTGCTTEEPEETTPIISETTTTSVTTTSPKPTPTESTTPGTTTSVTTTTESTTTTETTTITTTPCVCVYNGVPYPPGEIDSGVANDTWCYILICSPECKINVESWICSTSTTTTPTTSTVETTTTPTTTESTTITTTSGTSTSPTTPTTTTPTPTPGTSPTTESTTTSGTTTTITTPTTTSPTPTPGTSPTTESTTTSGTTTTITTPTTTSPTPTPGTSPTTESTPTTPGTTTTTTTPTPGISPTTESTTIPTTSGTTTSTTTPTTTTPTPPTGTSPTTESTTTSGTTTTTTKPTTTTPTPSPGTSPTTESTTKTTTSGTTTSTTTPTTTTPTPTPGTNPTTESTPTTPGTTTTTTTPTTTTPTPGTSPTTQSTTITTTSGTTTSTTTPTTTTPTPPTGTSPTIESTTTSGTTTTTTTPTTTTPTPTPSPGTSPTTESTTITTTSGTTTSTTTPTTTTPTPTPGTSPSTESTPTTPGTTTTTTTPTTTTPTPGTSPTTESTTITTTSGTTTSTTTPTTTTPTPPTGTSPTTELTTTPGTTTTTTTPTTTTPTPSPGTSSTTESTTITTTSGTTTSTTTPTTTTPTPTPGTSPTTESTPTTPGTTTTTTTPTTTTPTPGTSPTTESTTITTTSGTTTSTTTPTTTTPTPPTGTSPTTESTTTPEITTTTTTPTTTTPTPGTSSTTESTTITTTSGTTTSTTTPTTTTPTPTPGTSPTTESTPTTPGTTTTTTTPTTTTQTPGTSPTTESTTTITTTSGTTTSTTTPTTTTPTPTPGTSPTTESTPTTPGTTTTTTTPTTTTPTPGTSSTTESTTITTTSGTTTSTTTPTTTTPTPTPGTSPTTESTPTTPGTTTTTTTPTTTTPTPGTSPTTESTTITTTLGTTTSTTTPTTTTPTPSPGTSPTTESTTITTTSGTTTSTTTPTTTTPTPPTGTSPTTESTPTTSGTTATTTTPTTNTQTPGTSPTTESTTITTTSGTTTSTTTPTTTTPTPPTGTSPTTESTPTTPGTTTTTTTPTTTTPTPGTSPTTESTTITTTSGTTTSTTTPTTTTPTPPTGTSPTTESTTTPGITTTTTTTPTTTTPTPSPGTSPTTESTTITTTSGTTTSTTTPTTTTPTPPTGTSPTTESTPTTPGTTTTTTTPTTTTQTPGTSPTTESTTITTTSGTTTSTTTPTTTTPTPPTGTSPTTESTTTPGTTTTTTTSTPTPGTSPTTEITTTSGTTTTTTTTTHSTPSRVPTTPKPPGCPFEPFREHNETWMLCNCTMARCLENNTVEIIELKCEPPPIIECASGFAPVQVMDDDLCCWHWECDCVCSGWGDPHYVTFDGTYYSYQGSCTYTLVEEINQTIDNFGVYIDNYDCGARDRVSCPRDIIVRHETQTIRIAAKTMLPIDLQVIVNNDIVGTPYKKYGVSVYKSGINYVVEIPELGANITYNGMTFSIKLPYHRFGHNTQGQCGTCTNNRSDDCLTREGKIVSNCEIMADTWVVPDPRKPTCGSLKPTVPATSAPCKPSPLCDLILGPTFQSCHKALPPEHFYQACVYDSCHVLNTNIECTSLQQYAQLCSEHGVCIQWRDKVSECPLTCPSHKVYNACGPAVPRTCQTTPEELAQIKNDKRLVEGCFCPMGTKPFSLAVDVCVSTCGCVGPDNVPRAYGEEFQFDCQDCICREGGSGITCKEHKCPRLRDLKCELEGYYPVTQINPNDVCCEETVCKCDSSKCSNKSPNCGLGYEAIGGIAEGHCCPVYKCFKKKVCVHGNAEYLPGAAVLSDRCQTCTCVENADAEHGVEITCKHVPCSKTCPMGYELRESKSDCCGECYQTNCVINDDNKIHLLKHGESLRAQGDNCTFYTCTVIKNTFITSTSRIECPKFNEEDCEPDTIQLSPNGCCKICIEKSTSCTLQQTYEHLTYNNCISAEPVRMSRCEGSCNTFSIYSAAARSMSHKCTCCQDVQTTKKRVLLNCSDGSQVQHDYVEVEQCSCVNTNCESSHSSEEYTPARARRSLRKNRLLN